MDDDLPSPLALLLTTMHRYWKEGAVSEAVGLAKAVAPYLHAKAVAGQAADNLALMRDDQLNALCRSGAEGEGAEEEDTD